jgi:hypothetical protein
MNWLVLIEKIAFVGFIVSFICSTYFGFISHRNAKILFKELDKFTEDNPDEIVSDEETKEYFEKYNQTYVKPLLNDKAFRVLYTIFLSIAILARKYK